MKDKPLYEVRKISNLKDMIEQSAKLYADKAAFLVKPKTGGDYVPVSFKKFKEDIDVLGTALLSLELKGKKIALIGENRYEWATSYLAVCNGTGIIVPLDKELPQNEIENCLLRSHADAIIFSGGVSSNIENSLKNITSCKYFINMDIEEDTDGQLSYGRLMQKGKELLAQGGREYLDAVIDNEAMDILLFTSGTTDKSKAVMLSHRNIAENLMAMCSMLYIDDKDVFLSVLPMHHTYECTCGFLCQMYRGCTVAFCEGLRHIVKNLRESGCTVMNGVPLVFESIHKQLMNQVAKKPGGPGKLKLGIRLSKIAGVFGADIRRKLFAEIHDALGGHLRLFISGAAAIDPMVSKGFREIGIKLVQGYGLTECAPIVGLNRDCWFKDDAAGLPLPGLQVVINKPNSEGIGEIKVKGPSVMLGYYENKEATDASIRDGWFYTGDMGFMDSDGFIHITGRKKNVIVTKNGKNVYPEEIETLLNRSDYIKESLVYGTEGKDDVVVCAQIVPDREKIDEDVKNGVIGQADVNAIIGSEVKRINRELVTYKYVKEFTLRDNEFEKTTTKKIKRYQELA
ncbi:AMP-dependent synthetase/ligase [Ruminiclostridium cellobioparum]|uniref:Long-chain acyl-CoA synthetases (AMP-forming) n=1 Tax=Ruminiclostridium cellobioparum subsp. termitidis CT1112 TaxID=1195236 RepID=S0FSW0_RUMCE|nr:AMP-binding protein [Ruminiclostridium cellobioparum]EMS71613.1 Long-chain acyl-CoA synthetases (AMP-forming) [Ruminiclostridium cellobioparum subsp. termitidis CT1112]